jgi:hypothetical protein
MDKALEEIIGLPGAKDDNLGDFIGRMFEPAEAPAPDAPAETPDEPGDAEGVPDAPMDDAPASDVDDAQDDDDVAPTDAKAGAAFKKLKDELKEFRAREKEVLSKVEAAERRAAEAEAKLKRAQELAGGEDFEASLSDLKKRASVLDLENTPEWEQNVAQPLAHVMGQLKKLADAYSIDEEDIHGLLMEKNLRKQGERLEDLSESMDARARRVFERSIEDYQLVMEKKAELEQDAESTLTSIRENDRASRIRREQEQKAAVAAHADSIASALKGKLAGFEEEIDGSLSDVKAALANGVSEESQAFAALSGTLLPKVYRSLQESQKEVADLRATVAKYKTGSPSGKGEGKADTAGKPFSLADLLDPSKPSGLLDGVFGR